MYTARIYIEPKDILNKLSKEDRERFNHCVFSDVYKGSDGSLTITCIFLEDKDAEESECRYKYCDDGEIKLL